MKKLLISLLIFILVLLSMIYLIPYQSAQYIIYYTVIALFAFMICYMVLLVIGWWEPIICNIRGILIAKKSGVRIGKNVRITHKDRVSIGNNVSIGKNVDIFPVGGNYPSKVIIGNNVVIGDYNRFASCDCIEIEDDVLFAAYVHITDHSHEFKDVSVPVVKQDIFSKGPVRIGKGSWLGFRSEVLSGVTIGEHCVIAAGAIVTKDVPSYSIVAGVPARIIKRFDFEKKEWVSV